MRRPGRVIAGGHWAEMPQKRRAGVGNLLQQRFGIFRRDVQVLRCDFVGQSTGLGGVAGQNQCPKLFQALAGQIAARKMCGLPLQFFGHRLDQRRMPSNQNSRARRMLGLSDQICRGEIGPHALIGHDDHFAGTGDGIDIDFAKHVPLRQRHEQISGPDNLVNLRHAFYAVCQRRHRLSAA